MQDLTTGSLARHLLKTTGFMLVTMLLQTLYFLVDLYWVGRLGSQAVAGVAIGGNLSFLVLAITQMLGVGTTTLVSHAAGRKDRPEALRVFGQSQLIAVAVAAIFFIVAMTLRLPYARALAADTETARQAAAFLLWFIPAMTLQFGLVAMGAALRGVGLFKPGMVAQTVTVVLNMALAPVLMFGWGTGHPMGAAGTAQASLISIVVGTAWLARYFMRTDAFLTFAETPWRARPEIWRRLLAVGLPAGAEFALMGAYIVVVYVLSRPFGAAAQAGFGIGLRIVQALFLPVVALGFAVAPIAGQNVGARKEDRVREVFRLGVLQACALMGLLTMACQIAPAAMLAPFTRDPAVVVAGEEYLRITSWGFLGSGVVFVASSMFQAFGNTLPPLMSSLLRLGLTLGPALWLAQAAGFRMLWIWYLSVATGLVQMSVNLLLLRREVRARFSPGRA